ncbi:MAG: helix-turn-helix domain-containing protein [Pseudomonadota bacterium]|nr:helix-turn-helix domain-containing protein [Pseudomonadota bacterium]
MKIDTTLLKQERNRRAWSQDHLACVAGIGLRTLQRIESSGSASNESIASIATAFGMTVAEFVKDGIKPAGNFAIVRTLGMELPGVKEASSRFGFALKFKGRLLACEAIDKSAEPDSLMVTISRAQRKKLITQQPDTYYLTDHYAPYPAILVRLPRITRSDLKELLRKSWEFMQEDSK